MNYKKIKMIFLLSICFIFVTSINVYADDNLEQNSTFVANDWFEKYDVYEKSLLSTKQSAVYDKKLYNAIYQGLLNLDNEIRVEEFNMSIEDAKKVYSKVLIDNPRFFYVGGCYISYIPEDYIVFKPIYVYDKSSISTILKEVNSKVSEIINSVIKPGMSDFEKELAIHDYLVLNTRYDEKNYNANTIPQDSYNIYGTLIKGIAVCQGYSESLKLLLNEVGIECIVVSAPEMDHAWNMVTINGEKYHVDSTWNDPVPDRVGKVRYKYLNLTDIEMKKDHIWNYANYPTCNSDTYSNLWNIDNPIRENQYMYYIDNEDYIYKLDLNTLKSTQITNLRAPYFDISGDWIYFSNYSYGGYLFKIKTDGTGITQLNNTYSTDVYIEGNYVYYTVKDLGKVERIEIDVLPEEHYTGYVKWEEQSNISTDKVWRIKFNYVLDKNTANSNNIYITDAYGNLFKDVDISINDLGDIVFIQPTKNYDNDSIYYLYIENVVSAKGSILGKNVKMKFHTSTKLNNSDREI